jgi:hypothetical protein
MVILVILVLFPTSKANAFDSPFIHDAYEEIQCIENAIPIGDILVIYLINLRANHSYSILFTEGCSSRIDFNTDGNEENETILTMALIQEPNQGSICEILLINESGVLDVLNLYLFNPNDFRERYVLTIQKSHYYFFWGLILGIMTLASSIITIYYCLKYTRREQDE